MNLLKDKVILGALTILLFLSLSFFLFQLALTGGRYIKIDLAACLLSYNLIILASWLSFGWIGGAISSALAIIIALFISAISSTSLHYLHIASYLFTTVISYLYLNKFVEFRTEYLLKREKAEEECNTLAEKLEKETAQREALELKFTRYEALKGVAENLSDIFSQDRLTEFLAEEAFKIIGKSSRALLYLTDPESQGLVLVLSKQPPHFPKIKTKKGDIFDKWVLRHIQPLIVLDAAKDFRFPHDDILSNDVSFKSLIAVPMVSHNKVMGILRLDSRTPYTYNPDDLRLLDIISDLGAVSLHNNMLYQRASELAIRDGLTQLFVHRYFMERLTQEHSRALEKGHPLSILMIDIDHFKDYNDKYGHIAGDILLKHLSDIFTSIVAKGDIVARYGGEEFSVLLFGEDKEASREIAEKIRRKVEETIFYLRRMATGVTVSIGAATSPNDAKTPDGLLKAADENLYRAKREGRNRVCIR